MIVCDAPYPFDRLADEMMSIEVRYRDGSDLGADGLTLANHVACAEPLPAILLARTYRAIAATLVDREPAGADRWLAASVDLDPTFRWRPEELPAGSPLPDRLAALAATPHPLVSLERWLDPSIRVDGRARKRAEATDGVWHLVQDTAVGRAWWVLGADFPPEILTDAPPPPPRRSPRSRRQPGMVVVDGCGPAPCAKGVYEIGGLTVIAASGVLLGVASHQHANGHPSTGLFVASGVGLAAGLGMLSWGIAL